MMGSVAYWITAGVVMAVRGRDRTLRLLWCAIGQFWVSVGLWRFRAPWDVYAHTAAQVAVIYVAALSDDWIGRWAGATARVTQ